jgi:drug/metabolite transporter (DMT)-like permease
MKKIHITGSSKAEAVLAFTTLLWGMTFIVIKTGLSDASPLMFLCLRFSAASIPFLIIFRKRFRNLSGRTVRRAFFLSLFFFSGYAMQTIGLKYTTVAKSALFTYMFAVFVPPLQFFFTGKKPKMLNVIALAVVIIGMVIFTSPGNSSMNIGDWLTLIGAVGYSFFIIFVDRFTGEEDSVVLTGFQFVISAVLAGVLSVFFEDTFIHPTVNLTVSILYLAIPGSIIAISLMNKYQGLTTPVKACIIYALEPVFTIMFGWIILKESLSSSEMTGALLIVAGVVFTEIFSAFKKQKEALL